MADGNGKPVNWPARAERRPLLYRNFRSRQPRTSFRSAHWQRSLLDYWALASWSVRSVDWCPAGSRADPWSCDSRWPTGVNGHVAEFVHRVLTVCELERPGSKGLLWLYYAELCGVARRCLDHVGDADRRATMRAELAKARPAIAAALARYARHWCNLVPTHAQELARQERKPWSKYERIDAVWPGMP